MLELPGILNWAIDGLLDYGERGLCEPAAVREETKAYRSASDVVASFISECCREGQAVRSSALYERDKEWDGSDKPLSQKKFSQLMKDGGYTKESNREGKWFLGIEIEPEIKINLTGNREKCDGL